MLYCKCGYAIVETLLVEDGRVSAMNLTHLIATVYCCYPPNDKRQFYYIQTNNEKNIFVIYQY